MSKFSDYLDNQQNETWWEHPVYDTRGKEPVYDDGGDAAPGFFSSLFHNALGGLEGTVGGGLDYLGAFAKSQGEIDPDTWWNGLGDWLVNNGEYLNNQADSIQQQYGTLNKYQNETLGQRLTDLDYLTDSRGLTADIFNGLGSSVPFVAASMLAPEVGVGGWLARGAGSALERMGASRLGQAVASDLVQAGANDFARYALTSGPLEAAVNAGGIYDDLKNQGLSDSEILGKMNSMIGEELPVDMLTSGLYGAVLGGNTFSRLGQGGWKRAIAANALNTPADMLGEYMQEMTQQQVQNKYSGKPYGTFFNPTEDEMQAGRAAAMGTLPMGIFGSARGTRHSRLAAMAAADGGSVTGPEPVTPPAVPDPNVDPVAAAQLEGKNGDVPTADGVDVTELDPQQFEQWYDGKVSAPKLDMPSGNIDVPNPNVGNSGKNSGTNVMEAAQGFMGKRMDNGENGCVEAVTKIGARYNPFLADELNKGVVNVDTLVGDAGDAVVPFAPANVQAGDVLVYGDNDHVVIADGNGGYVGNSSSQKKVVHGDDYNNMGDLKPTKIIKTGGTESQASDTLEGNGSLTKSSGNDQYDAWITQSAAEHGVPANLLSSLLEVESGYNPDAKSGAGAVGIAQFMPSTAEEIGIDPMDPQQAIDGAAIYLRQKYDKYGDWHKALEAYNGGDGNVGKGETMAYADKVLDGAGDISAAPVQTAAKNMTLPQLGDLLTSKLIDFAGTNDDTVRTVFNDISTSKDTAIASLFAPYMQDGVFQNTADARAILAKNDAFRKALSMFIHAHIGDYAPTVKDGKVTISDVREALRLRPAGKVQAPHIDVKNLSSADKKAIMAVAKVAMQTPQGLPMDEEVRFMTKLSKAIDYKDYTAIVNLIPQQAAQVVMAARGTDKAADNPVPVMQDAARANGSVNETATQAPVSQQAQNQVPASVAVNGPVPVNHAPETMQNVSVQAPANHMSDGVRAATPTRDVARVKEIGAMPVDTRKAMGERYLSTLRANNVPFSEKRLAKPLAQGRPKAIEFAERKYGDLLNTVTPAEAAAASQHTASRTIQAATTARLANMVSEITSGNTYKNASPVGKLAYLTVASAHAKTVGANESVKTINGIIDHVRKEAGLSGKGLTEGMTSAQKDEFYSTFYKQSLDDATAIRKEAKDEKPANLKSLNNTIEMFKQELANSKPTKEARKEVTHESTQSKSQNEPDKGTKNQDQHAKPEPRKAADTQREAEEGEVKRRETRDKYYEMADHYQDSGNKKAADDGGRVVVTGKEFGEYGSVKELRKKALDYYSNHLQGTSVTNKQLGAVDFDRVESVDFTGAGKREVKHTSAKEEKLLLVKHLRSLIQNASDITEENAKKERHAGEHFYYLHTGAEINRKDTPVEITLVKRGDGKIQFYNHTLPSLEKTAHKKEPLVSPAPASSNEALGSPAVNGSSTHIIPHEQKEGTKNIAYTDGRFSDKSKDDTAMRGTVKNGVMTIWSKRCKKKDTPIITVSVDEVNQALEKGGANSEYTLHQLAKQKDYAAVEAWIKGTKKPELRQRRRDSWEENKLYPAEDRAIDSAVCVIRKLYETATGEPPRSPWEKNQEAKKNALETRAQEKPVQEKAESTKAEEKDDSIFGSVEDADKEMLDALGLSDEDLKEEVLEAPEGISNTAEERERLEKELAAELNKLSANPVFNPKIYTLGLKLAMTYVKDGYNTFKKLVTKLHAAFGDKIGPWAPALAETVRTWPKGVPFDEKKVMAISKAVGARYEGGITSLDAMQDDMKKLLKGQHKSFAPMIEASYNGIRKFFDEKGAQEHGDEGKQEKGESSDAGREGRQSAASEGAGEGRPEPGGVSGAEGGNREVTRGGNPGRSEREDPERVESSGVRAGAELETAAGAGDRERGSEKPVLTEAQAHPSPEETPGHDYEIKPSKTKKTPAMRFRQNIDALKLLKQLEADDRMPTPKEQAVLGSYNGWGGLKEAFLDTKMNKELRAVLTPEEYKAAQSTVNDAFYTPAGIVRAVWKGVSRLGFTGGRVLDPSMGVGNFFGCMPRDMMKSSSLRGIEIDDLTSRLARMLYPSALVEHTGFEKAQLADNFYDLVISNIPFDGSHSIAGYKIHNYFFAHGMDKVRPGGLMVYITSQGSLTNSQDGARMRDYLGKKADMVAAYKLPSGAFGEAGTSVGTDIVIFRKRGEHEMKPGYAQDFQHVGKMFTYSDNSGGVPVNEYFKAHPENIIGEASKGRDQYGNDVLLVKPKEDADVAKELSKAMNKLPKDIYEPVNRTGEGAFDPVKANRKARADEKTHDLEYYEKDGKVYQNQDGTGVEVKGAKTIARLKGYLKVKGAMNSLILAEMDPDAKEATVGHLRKQLNAAYDAYVKKNGYLNDPVGRRSYIDDPSAGAVMALEKVEYTGFGAKKKIEKAEKAAIFEERSIAPIKEVTSVDSPNDALIVSLRNKGRVDLPYMAKLMGSTPETVASGLDGQIFKNPATERYETRDEYLSGNVREKFAQAENAAAQDPSYQKNADELRKVVPKDLIPDEICVTMGAPWIPASDVQAFADHITGRAGSLSVKFIPSNAKWVVDGYGHSGKYEAKGIDLSDLLFDILNNKAIEIYSGRGDERALDREATDAANVIAGDMKEDFRTWLWSDKARAKRLARYYNDNYNNTVLREYDGSHLTFPGHNEKIELMPHQKNVVWRMLQGGNTLIAHCVGAGKTFEMQAAGMEMRRLGIANKPLYILPNNVVEQFTKEFYELYPNARLLVLQNDSKTRPGYIPAVPKSTIEQKVEREDGRKETVTIQFSKLSAADRKKVTEARALRTRTLAQIKTEDWDGIIMSHSQFERLPLSPETAASFIEEQLDEVEQAITEAKEGKVDKRTLGTIENQKKKLEENLDAVMKTDPRDIGVPFEQLGIDQIFVDEADMFKNLHYTTSMDRVNGLPNSNANRSMDMYAKTRWLTNANGGRGVVFATGTPVSNTMAEMFTMMRYLDFQGLKEKGLNLFDNWLRTFGEIGSGIERNPSGSGFRKVNKVLRFINMPELTKMFRKFADVKTQDDLDLDIPKLKGGKPTIVKIAPDPVLTNYIKNDVPRRIANMAKRREDMRKGADNMLALTGDLRKMSITDSKIDALADEVVRKYEETTDVKGAQLIFCDQGIPKAEKDNAKDDEEGEDNSAEAENAPVYNKIITALEERGIPKEQIVFIQSAKNKAQMEEIFKKVDSGDIRILIGSTQKMGAGTNCQHHLVALHDLDAPWRPRDLEQRHGRILRQGNPNKEVEIFNYVLQDSFDPIMWEKLKNKAAIVAQAMSSNMQQRIVEDADLVTLTYADAENAGTSDPLVKERIALDSEIKKYKHAQVAFNRKMGDAESAMETAPKKIEELKSAIENIKDDMDARQDTRGDKFRMTVAGKEYTERKEAQTALGSALADLTGKVSTKIGEVSGFDIKAYLGSDNQPHIQLVRKRAYMANTATVAGVENALRKAPETLLKAREAELRKEEDRLKTAKEIVGQKNPYAEKLATMEKRFKEINRQIEDNMLGKADDSKERSETPDEAYSVEEQAAAKERAIDDLKQEVRDALPGAHSIEDDGDTVSFTMPNGARVQVLLSPSIEIDVASAAKARAAHGVKPEARLRINGRERTVGQTALIELSQLGRKGSAYHEVLHAVYDLCLTEKEKAALHRAFDKEAKAQGRDVYEVMADQYRDWMLARQQGRGTRFGKLWQKIKDMAAALLRVLRGADHASDVFRKVESGAVWKRATDAGKTQKKYSAEGVENPGEAAYNEDKVSKSVFDKYLNDGIMQMVRETVAKEIGEHVDLADMSDPVKRDAARDQLPYIRDMLVKYHQLVGMKMKPAYIDRMAAKIEYARRCFDHDERVEHGALRQVVGMQKPSGVYLADDAALRSGQKESGVNGGRVRVQRGISRSISGEKSGARAHFEKLYNDMAKSRSDNQDGFSSAQNPMHYSVEAEEAPKNFVKKVFLKLAKKSHIKGDKIIVEEQGEEKPTIGLTNYVLSSPSRIASKVQSFRMFFRMADRAMNILTKNRSDYARKLGEAMDFVKKKSDRQALYEILLNGDAEGKEYTRQELVDDGISDNVIEAYMRIRRLMTKAYRMVDDARRRPKVTSKRMTDRKIAELRENHFIEVMRVGAEEDDGRRLVTYKEYANHEKVYQNIDQETRDRFRADDAMQVLGEKKNGDGSYTVKVREGIPHMNRLGGYIPHFFHDYMIRVKDSDGGYVMTLGSGRTEREAVKKAEAYLKEHALPEGQKIYISPKVMDFTTLGMSEQQYGAVMGDMDYFKMLASIAKNNDLSLEEAKALMEGSARMKNRHRFFCNAMHRTGVKGYETDLDWVLRHYFNSASRYAALETEFKPQAISLYERLYGDFNRDAPSKEADYVKDYINDINGNPSTLETAITEALMKSKLFRQFIVPRFGDRAALTLGSKLSNAVSYMCLGYFNTSSALLNLTQVMNSAAYIGDVSALAKCIAKGAHRKYSMHDLKILMETNVLNDIGLDSGSGYDMNRMSAKNLLGKLNRGGMWMFKTSEGIVRRGTVLAAYEAGRKRGMTHEEAIAFAKDVNRKSNFDYGVSDAPNIFRRGSIVSQLALQFKKYGIKELEVMADMFPTNSKTSRKQKAIFWGTYFLAAGLMGLPMLDFFDKWPFDEKLKLSVEECLMEAAGDNPLGKKLATAALFGVAAAVLGIDLSNRAGLSDVIPTRGSDLMGPALSKVANLISDSLKGNGMSAIRDVSPGIYNVMAAVRGYSEGKRGRVNDRYNTFYDKVLRAMGFKSTDERVNSDIDRIVNMRKRKETQEKQDAIDAYLDNPSAENARRLKALGVKPKAVADERKKKQQSRRERTQSGMSKPKQQENERLMQFGD